jgi:hypothetical protein
MQSSVTAALGFLASTDSAPDRSRGFASYRVLPPPLPPVRLEEVPGESGRFRVTAPYVFTAPWGANYEIPAGYTTDLASSPRALWSLLAPHELGFTATTIHDFLRDKGPGLGVTRAEADAAFEAVLERQLVDPTKALRAIAAVRLWSRFRSAEERLTQHLAASGSWQTLRMTTKTLAPIVLAALRSRRVGLVSEAWRIGKPLLAEFLHRRGKAPQRKAIKDIGDLMALPSNDEFTIDL